MSCLNTASGLLSGNTLLIDKNYSAKRFVDLRMGFQIIYKKFLTDFLHYLFRNNR